MPTYEYDLNSIAPVYTTYNSINSIGAMSSKFDNVDEKIKGYEEKLDKHVEQLEEDIQFFNEERLKQEEAIKALINAGAEKDKKIKNLEDICNYLESRLCVLEDKLNEN